MKISIRLYNNAFVFSRGYAKAFPASSAVEAMTAVAVAVWTAMAVVVAAAGALGTTMAVAVEGWGNRDISKTRNDFIDGYDISLSIGLVAIKLHGTIYVVMLACKLQEAKYGWSRLRPGRARQQ